MPDSLIPALCPVLCIDTSGASCSVALQTQNRLITLSESCPRGHNRRLIPMLRAACLEAGITFSDLRLLGYVAGPGSFTGLRISVGLVQGLAYGLAIPTVAISSLAALAAPSADAGLNILAASHARADEIFFAYYRPAAGRPGGLELLGKESVLRAEELNLPPAAYIGVGSAWQKSDLRQQMAAKLGEPVKTVTVSDPDIGQVMQLTLDFAARGLVQPALSARPSYLREYVAKASSGR